MPDDEAYACCRHCDHLDGPEYGRHDALCPEGCNERWRRIPPNRMLGIPRGYEASNDNRIRSVPRRLRDGRRAGGQVLSQWLDEDGYAMVKVGGRPRHVHVLVQLAWAGPPEVRHLDGNKSNNKPENLAWGSRVENEQDKRRGKEVDGRESCDSPFPSETSGTGELPR